VKNPDLISLLYRLLLLLAVWTTSPPFEVAASFDPVPSVREYTETTGQNSRYFRWTLQQADGWLLTSVDEYESHKTWFDTDLATYKWTLEKPADNTSILAWREGALLHIEGTFNGKAYQRTHDLAGAPWFQALSLSLRRYLGETPDDHDFWTIRPDNLDLHRLRISKITEEPVPVGQRTVPAFRIEIRPTGWKASFWKGVYWFRKEDGDFVRYHGPSGPPGWPPTIVELSGSPGAAGSLSDGSIRE
jgi:hypothetical protein